MTTKWMAVLGFAAALGLAGPAEAAMPLAALDLGSPIIQASGGCGPYGHRGYYGSCRPGGQWGSGYRRIARACPPGWHLGYAARRCWPNRY